MEYVRQSKETWQQVERKQLRYSLFGLEGKICWAGRWPLVPLGAQGGHCTGQARATGQKWFLQICRNKFDSAVIGKVKKYQRNVKYDGKLRSKCCFKRLPEPFALK